MSNSICWDLTCDGLVSNPSRGKSLACLTLPGEISIGSNEPQGLEKGLVSVTIYLINHKIQVLLKKFKEMERSWPLYVT